ncbi:hypothetical protein Hanom_Chr07g00633901 [Helianthus anomalus]
MLVTPARLELSWWACWAYFRQSEKCRRRRNCEDKWRRVFGSGPGFWVCSVIVCDVWYLMETILIEDGVIWTVDWISLGVKLYTCRGVR